MDDGVILKLDTIKISEKRATRKNILNSIKLLQQKLRHFFDEADGHGSLIRKPPSAMFTPQYFKTVRRFSNYSIQRMDWMSLITTTKFKKRILPNSDAIKAQRSNSIFNSLRVNLKKIKN